MYKKVPFVEKPFHELTKDELRSMIRVTDGRIPVEEMLEHYNITIKEYFDFIQSNGMIVAPRERQIRYNIEKAEQEAIEAAKQAKINEKYVPKNEDEETDFLVWDKLQIPEFVLAALYNMKCEIIDGKRHYDRKLMDRAKAAIRKKVRDYLTENREPPKYPDPPPIMSHIKPIELVAMRMYRGYRREKFSSVSGLDVGKIILYETKVKEVPQWVVDIYIKTLEIKERNLKQLRAVLNGEAGYIEENREIPPLVRMRVWRRDKGRCTNCGARKKLHYHHIKHYADGGLHIEANLKLLCAKCHAEEHKGERAYSMLKKIAEED